MLDDYMDKQPIAYNIMMNEIKNDHISHAYLIDENNASESFEMVMAFVKEIICNGLNLEIANTLRKRIDDGNYGEIKIIEPDGLLIKKQQIIDLQKEFAMAAVEGKKRVYIIRDADKMRSETANSMLKFLEEPDNDIVAILMTNNINNLLSTIISRCQIIRLNNTGTNDEDNDIENIALSFIKAIEFDGIKTIINEQNLLFTNLGIKERDKYIILFDKMIDMYYDILKVLTGDEKIKYFKYLDEFKNIAKKNTNEKLLDKINILLTEKDTIKNNVNVNLLIDSIIIEVGGM